MKAEFSVSGDLLSTGLQARSKLTTAANNTKASALMLHADNPNPNLFEKIRRRFAYLVDKLNIPASWVLPVVSAAIGYRASSERGGWAGRISFGDSETKSLYYNGVIFVRFALPFLICLQIRWSGDMLHRRQYLQTHIGWRLNGQFGIAFRVQCDMTAAIGTTGPNYGQAYGWHEGTK